ncbi:hypothetical protein [Algoriphagus sediminis]|uniref:Uncharacterized protein n=1 Tax=Algoriphagus sediminis TaxID=3057113 RepID=A0ABT7YDC1_9BACT|nr:hypothetical protein [Algoriphagus sediminis]MDN3204529.1 hypothetical protein [Algoriphagus sediminis]
MIPNLKNSLTLFLAILLLGLPEISNAQTSISMSAVESRKEVSMAEATGKRSDGVYRYYAKGENKPFTGALFAKYPNGNYSS